VTITAWLACAVADADARGLSALRPLLETLARSTTALRAAPWNDDASATAAVVAAGSAPPTAPDAR